MHAGTAVALTALFAAAPAGQAPVLAPGFDLPDLEGARHRLSDLRGKVVVLEWTNHACPAVAGMSEGGRPQDTRAAVEALGLERTVWFQVDSSWFAPALADQIHDWRRRLGAEAPLLLDSDGAVARAYGAVATPQFFVIAGDGTLAYSGALDSHVHGEAENERRNHVLEAVEALLAGRAVPRERTRAFGCTLKIGTPRGPLSPAEVERLVDEDARAKALYARAARAAATGDRDGALARLREALGAGLPRLWSAVADPALRPLLADGEARRALRSLLEEQPARGVLRMTAPDEPGRPFVLAGTVRDEDGEPIPGAVLWLYHTDAAGWYSAGSTEGDNARLFGRVATDARGRYRVRTIVPGRYARIGGPVHVHMGVRAEGYRMQSGHRASVFFADDPELAGAAREEIESDGCAILPRGRNAEGVVLCVQDITLERG